MGLLERIDLALAGSDRWYRFATRRARRIVGERASARLSLVMEDDRIVGGGQYTDVRREIGQIVRGQN